MREPEYTDDIQMHFAILAMVWCLPVYFVDDEEVEATISECIERVKDFVVSRGWSEAEAWPIAFSHVSFALLDSGLTIPRA